MGQYFSYFPSSPAPTMPSTPKVPPKKKAKPSIAQDQRTIQKLREQGDPDTDPGPDDQFVPDPEGSFWKRGSGRT